MHPITFTLLVFLILVAPVQAKTYTLDPAHTYPQFEIYYLLLSTVHGQFNHVEGRITMDREKNLGSVDVTIDVKSLYTGSAKRDEDLLSESFFDAAKFPAMSFKSTLVAYQGRDSATAEGNFTLHGVTRPLTLHVTRISCDMSPILKKNVCRFDSWGKIKRSDFGMKSYLPLIQDEVKLIINADAVEESDLP